jgi:hypothetical protein
MEISGEALRREGGFDEDDKPKADELEQMGLKAMLRNTPGAAPAALDALVGKKVLQPAGAPGASGAAQPPGTPPVPPQKEAQPAPVPKEGAGPPAKGEPPTKPPAKATTEEIAEQVRAKHAIRFGVDSHGDLLHPPVCREHSYSCPFTHAARDAIPVKLATGTYECKLDTFGRLNIGQPVPYLDTSAWLMTPGFATAWKGELHGRAGV